MPEMHTPGRCPNCIGRAWYMFLLLRQKNKTGKKLYYFLDLNDTEGMLKKALHSKNFLYESPFRVNFVEFAQKSGAERGYDTVAVFCDVFPKICGDVFWAYAFCAWLCAS